MFDAVSAALTSLTTAAGGFLQALTGFGFGILTMAVFPHILGEASAAAAVTGVLSVLGSGTVSYRMRKKLSFRRCLWPFIGYFVFASAAILFSVSLPDIRLKILLGGLLIALSVYFSFFTEKIHIPSTPFTGIIAGSLSGILGGLFSISGPPAVLYFSASSSDNDTYMADTQLYFAVTSLYATFLRVVSGKLTLGLVPVIAAGYAGSLLGLYLGGKIYSRLNRKTLIRLICVMMAISGINLMLGR